MELIDKDAIVAEIEKRLDELWNLLPNTSDVIKDNYTKEEANIIGKYTALESFENFINTLEVKEVDLKKEIDSYFERFQNVQCDEDCCNEGGFCCVLDNDLKIVDIERCRKIARHFFELGLKAQKGE